MNLLGVELNNKEAILCLMSSENGLFNVKECRTRGIEFRNSESQESVQGFQFQIKKFIEDYKVDKVLIKQRVTSGKFAGSSNSFKMEAAFQLLEGVEVELIHTKEIKETLKQNPLGYSMKELELRQFQEQAFNTAYSYALRRT